MASAAGARTALLAAALTTAGCGATSGPVAGPVHVIDRSVMPEPGSTPAYDFPAVERFTLSNGLGVSVVDRPGLGTIYLSLVVDAGMRTDPVDRPGLAAMTATMLTEGTTARTASQLAEDVEFLAANLSSGVGLETGTLQLSILSRHLEAGLEILADVVMNPAFREADWARVRDRQLVSIGQAAEQPSTVADLTFARILYGDGHPLGRPSWGSAETVRSLMPSELTAFHAARYRPELGHLIVVGDAGGNELIQRLERSLGRWSPPAAPVEPGITPAPGAAHGDTRIYLVDRPGAAQSELRIGHFGLERTHPDYFPVLVMNTLLGGQFSSRIMLNLREDKGYTYGARSYFDWRRIPGPFTAATAVESSVTRESVIELMRELNDIRGPRPARQEEVEFARNSLIRREPISLETNAQIADRVQTLLLYGFPDDYFDHYADRIAAVTVDEVNRVAREYLTPDRAAIVVVGDGSVVEAELRQLPYGFEATTARVAN